jgi:DNA-binding protein H-NS
MAKMNIEKLSLKELVELEREVKEAIVIKQGEEKDALKAQMRKMAEEAGLSLDEILGVKRGGGRKSAGASAAKFRNPDNPAETWTGRGRRPQWLLEKLSKKGVTVDDFAV